MWTNYGDVNFIEYGGCLIKPHWTEEELKKFPELSNMYDVFYLHTEVGDDGDKKAAVLCTVDISDTWINKKDILYAIGLEKLKDKPMEEIMKPELWAKEIVEYYGPFVFDGVAYHQMYPIFWADAIISDEDIIKWMNELGIKLDDNNARIH